VNTESDRATTEACLTSDHDPITMPVPAVPSDWHRRDANRVLEHAQFVQ
jgi:hypothetical protein